MGRPGIRVYPAYASPEPRRWENVSSLRLPLLVLLGAEAVLALLISVVPLVGLLHALLFLVTAVVFLVWLHRARRNAVAVRHQFGPGWAIGGWFVPLANVYIPLRVVLDTGWAAVRAGRRGDGDLAGRRVVGVLGAVVGDRLPADDDGEGHRHVEVVGVLRRLRPRRDVAQLGVPGAGRRLAGGGRAPDHGRPGAGRPDSLSRRVCSFSTSTVRTTQSAMTCCSAGL